MRPYIINSIVGIVTLIIAFVSYMASGARAPFVFAFLFLVLIPFLIKEKKIIIYIAVFISALLGISSTGMAFRDGMVKKPIAQAEMEALRVQRNAGNFSEEQEKYWRTVIGEEERPRKVFNYAAIGLIALWGAGMHIAFLRKKRSVQNS